MSNTNLKNEFPATELLLNYTTSPCSLSISTGTSKVDAVIVPTSITGRQAATIQLEKLGFELGETFHAKLDNNIIFKGTVTHTGFSIRPQEKVLASSADQPCKKGTWINTVKNSKTGLITYEVCREGTKAALWIDAGNSIYTDGWGYLEGKQQDVGLFIIPNHTKGGIGSEYATDFSNLFIETDDHSIPEQWKKINQIQADYGITPSLVVYSGGKSLHVYYRLRENVAPAIWQRLQHKLILLFKSDPAIKNLSREMRFAGFTRQNRGTQQSVDFYSDASYSLEDFEARLNSTGYFPYGLSKERWDEASKALKFDGDRDAEIKRILSLSEESLAKNVKKAKVESTTRQAKTPTGLNYIGSGEGNLYDAVAAWKRTGGRDLFDWPGHNWDGAERRGCCPWHESTTGTSFWLGDPLEDGTVLAHCPTCTDNNPIDALKYQYWLENGLDAEFSGKVWADFAKKVTGYVDSPFVASVGGTKPPTPTPEEDALQLELERNLYHESSRIDYKKCEELGIKVVFIEKSHTDFTPEDLNIERGKISIVSSGMGTGKTVNAGKALADYPCLYSWFSRRVLAQSASQTLDLTYIDNVNKDTKNRNRLSFCSQRSYQQSLTPMRTGGALVVDECDDVFDYNFEDLCNRENIRPVILKSLETQLDAALHNGTALFMSADVSQKEIDYIFAIAPKGTPIELIINTWQMPKGKCYFSTDASPDGLIEKILELVKAGEPVYLLDDFKNGYKGCKTLSAYIQQQMPGSKVITIHGDNSGSNENRDYVEDINKSSLTTHLICVSPSVTQGVSITNGHFKHVFAVINGILTDKKVTQGISRVRGAENTYLWVAEKGVNINAGGGITAGDINDYFQRNYAARNLFLHSYGVSYDVRKDEWNSPHWQMRCKNLAYSNLVMRRLRYWVQERLQGLGYELIPTEFGENKESSSLRKDIWKAIGVEEALRIGDANILDKVDEEKLIAKDKRGEPLTPSEKADIAKTHIHKVFGEELATKTRAEAKLNARTVNLTGYAAVAYKNRNREFERNLMRNYRLFHGGAEEAAQRDINKEKAQERLGKIFVGDIKWSLREFRMWEAFGVAEFFKPMVKYSALDFYPTYMRMQELKDHIKDAGWVDISKSQCGKVFGDILHDFAFETESKQITLGDGKRGREYWITQESFDYVTEFINYQLAKKAKSDSEEKPQNPDCTHPPTFIVKDFLKGGCVQETQSITPQSIQPIFETPKMGQEIEGKNASVENSKIGVCSSVLDENIFQQANRKADPTEVMMARMNKPVLDKDGLPPLYKPGKKAKSAIAKA